MSGEITSLASTAATETASYAPAKAPSRPVVAAPVSEAGDARLGESVALSSAGLARYTARLDQLEAANHAAYTVRLTDGTMAKVGDALDKIKQALIHIVKQYPPYGLDSSERAEYLNSISGLRKQIEALIPFPGGGGEPAKGAIEISLPGSQPQVVKAEIPGLGPDGLDIPVLGNRASDDEVATALARASAAADRIDAARTELAEAVHRIISTADEAVEDLLLLDR